METQQKAPPPLPFPPGALLRVEQIVGNPKKGLQGLIPVSAATWWRWVKDGRVPAGRKLGPQVTAWPIEVVMAVGMPANDAQEAA